MDFPWLLIDFKCFCNGLLVIVRIVSASLSLSTRTLPPPLFARSAASCRYLCFLMSCLQWPSIFGCGGVAPRRQSTNFRHAPKSAQEVKKSTNRRPRVELSWILIDFWWSFWKHFLKFLQNAETLILVTITVDLKVFALPKHLLSGSIVHLFPRFLWKPSWIHFSSIFYPFPIKNKHLGSTWRPSWTAKSPFGPTLFFQKPTFQFPAYGAKCLDLQLQFFSADLVHRSRLK